MKIKFEIWFYRIEQAAENTIKKVHEPWDFKENRSKKDLYTENQIELFEILGKHNKVRELGEFDTHRTYSE